MFPRILASFFFLSLTTLAHAADPVPAIRAVHGPLEVRTMNGFSAADGNWREAPVVMRAGVGGAVVELGTAGASFGKLWLAEGATAQISGVGGGALMTLESAKARLSVFDERLPMRVATEHGTIDIKGSDVLLERGASGTTLGVTSDDLSQADWTLDVEAETAPVGVGSLETRTRGGDVARLDLVSVHVEAKVFGDVVETRVIHMFANRSRERLEGTFRFPLPDGASPTGLALEIDGRMMEGEITDRASAEKAYRNIVDMMLDPAILTWEQGQTFKLRVFPIEPESTKKVELRYVSPLRREGAAWRWAYPTAAADMQTTLPELTVDFQGRRVLTAKDFKPGQDVVATLPASESPAPVLREVRAEATFTSLRVQPDFWKDLPRVTATGPRTLIAVVDTSRSMLETQTLTRDTLASLLAGLTTKDKFVVLACDVTCRHPEASPRLATRAAIAEAVAELATIEPDGASDLALALTTAGQVARRAGGAEVVMIGDGVPTWRETDPTALATLAASALAGASLHALVLGKGARSDLMERLTGLLGGKVERPRTARDAARFALFLSRARNVRSLTALEVHAGEQDSVRLPEGTSLFEGDALAALIKTPAGIAAPTSIKVSGLAAGKPVSFTVALPAPVDTKKVARRFAAEEIASLESANTKGNTELAAANKLTIIELSKTYGVLSKETALLVLESDEAYEKYQIERRQAAADAAENQANNAITGQDLENLAQSASLDPDHIQPGDPEVHIPAPADARSVVVVFPFGDTKIARWDTNLRAWVVRFLIDAGTPDGTYRVQIRITHRDRHIEILSLPYVVDTRAPTVDVTMKPAAKRARAPGTWQILATQVVSETELTGDAPGSTLDGRRARIVSDAKRVDVRLPTGEVIALTAIRSGVFRGYWKPATPLTGPVTLTVVAVDVALNRQVFEVTLNPVGGVL